MKKRRITIGTILIEKSGGSPNQAAGRVAYCDANFNGTASNFIQIVTVRADFCAHYVAYLLNHLYQVGLVRKYQQQTTGIINFKLNEYIEEVAGCSTSKAEQIKIAEILTAVDRAIEQTEALIAKQQRIKTGVMQDLLTRGIDEQGNLRSESTHKFKDSPLGRIPLEWEVDNLSSRALVKGGTPPAGHAYAEGNAGYRYLRTMDFINKRLNYSSLKCLFQNTFRLLERYEIESGDIFISIAGVNLGVAGVFRPQFTERTILTENAAKIRLFTDEFPEYLVFQLNSSVVQQQIIEAKGVTGAGVPKVPFSESQLRISWPSKRSKCRLSVA